MSCLALPEATSSHRSLTCVAAPCSKAWICQHADPLHCLRHGVGIRHHDAARSYGSLLAAPPSLCCSPCMGWTVNKGQHGHYQMCALGSGACSASDKLGAAGLGAEHPWHQRHDTK